MKIRKNGFLKTGEIMSLVLATVIVTGFSGHRMGRLR